MVRFCRRWPLALNESCPTNPQGAKRGLNREFGAKFVFFFFLQTEIDLSYRQIDR